MSGAARITLAEADEAWRRAHAVTADDVVRVTSLPFLSVQGGLQDLARAVGLYLRDRSHEWHPAWRAVAAHVVDGLPLVIAGDGLIESVARHAVSHLLGPTWTARLIFPALAVAR